MKVRFTNQFLLTMGITFGTLNVFFPSLFLSFMFGTCFGAIWLNFYEKDK